jgi:hypothetical protein
LAAIDRTKLQNGSFDEIYATQPTTALMKEGIAILHLLLMNGTDTLSSSANPWHWYRCDGNSAIPSRSCLEPDQGRSRQIATLM